MAAALAYIGMVLEHITDHASAFGFAMKMLVLAMAIPLLLVLFNVLCDRWERQADGAAVTPRSPTDPASTNTRGETSDVIGRVSRSENYKLPRAHGWFYGTGTRAKHSS